MALAIFSEACDVGAHDQVALMAVFLGRIISVVEDVDHDSLQLGIHFLKSPGVTHGVLAHLQAGGCNAAGIGCLSGSEQNAGRLGTPRWLQE